MRRDSQCGMRRLKAVKAGREGKVGTMDGRCENHQFEILADHCRTCGGEYCLECLVYSYGNDKPPFCVDCALAAAGIRSTAKRPSFRSRRELRREARLKRRAAKVNVVEEPAAAPVPLVRYEFTITDDGEIEYADDTAEAGRPQAS